MYVFNAKFNVKPSNGIRVDTWGWADRRTDGHKEGETRFFPTVRASVTHFSASCSSFLFPFIPYVFNGPLDPKYFNPFISFWISHNWRHKNWTVNIFYLLMRSIYCMYQIWRHCVHVCDYTRVTTSQKLGKRRGSVIAYWKNAVHNLSLRNWSSSNKAKISQLLQTVFILFYLLYFIYLFWCFADRAS
jgi:hypothetical protein